MQAEREVADRQRIVLGLPPLSWAALQQIEATVSRHAQLWAAWAGLQSSWADWNTKTLLTNTGQVGQLPCCSLLACRGCRVLQLTSGSPSC